MKRYSVSEPQLDGNEERYVLDCLRNNRLSMGDYVRRFEELFACFTNTAHAISCMNGTAALHLAMLAMNVQPGDEVIVPALTYVASANAVTYCGGTPVFCDVDPNTWCLDTTNLQVTNKTVGILPVHLYGHPAAMDPIREIAMEQSLWVIEDAAEAHGALYRKQIVGSLGNAGVFSFYGNKIMTTGEGGMLVTNDDAIARLAVLYRGQGVDTQIHRYHHAVVGYNYRMTDLQAAIGLAQLERIQYKTCVRREVAEQYRKRFTGSRICMQVNAPDVVPANWMFTILTPPGIDRDRVMKMLEQRGIETRPAFRCMHHLPIYQSVERFPVAESISARGINLPTHAGLSREDVNYIADNVLECLEAA
jgi:perosamine synthetase